MARADSYESLYGDDAVQRRKAKTAYAPAPVAETADTGIPAPTDTSYEVDTGIPQYTQPTPPAPSPYASRYQSIVDAYSKYLGRTPSDPEILSQTGHGSFGQFDPRLGYSIRNIQGSPEAQAYASRQPAGAAAPTTGGQVSSAMPGWEQSKWADPSHNSIKYQAGRIFSQFDPNAIRQNPAPLLAALKAAGINATLVGDDKLDFGDGYGPIDVITSGGQWAWQPGGGGDTGAVQGAAPQNPAMAGGAPGTAQSFQQSLFRAAQGALGGQTGAAGGQAGQAGASSGPAFDEAVRQMVLRLMRQQPTDITNDPVYQGAMSAYGQQQQRAKERNRNAIAERSAAEGTLNTGGFSDRILGAEQQQGEAEASFAGNLGIRELERQREEVMQALQIGAGLMTDEDRLALTEKLGLINAALQQQGLGLQQQSITNQNNQFNQNLGWDMSQFQWLQNMLPFLTA
jgi:hypothetical protein